MKSSKKSLFHCSKRCNGKKFFFLVGILAISGFPIFLNQNVNFDEESPTSNEKLTTFFFPELSQSDNIELISESPYSTQWNFVNTSTPSTTLYNETFNSWSNWSLQSNPYTFIANDPSPYATEWVNFSGFTYTGENPSIVAQDNAPSGAYFHEGFWFVCGQQYDIIHKYYENWTYTGINFSSGLQPNTLQWQPRSLQFYNGIWYLLTVKLPEIEISVLEFYDNWTYTGTWHSLYSRDQSMSDFRFHDGFWYLLGYDNDKVYKYTTSWSYVTSWDISGEGSWGFILERANNYWFIVQAIGEEVFQYDDNFNLIRKYADLTAQSTDPWHLEWKPFKWYYIAGSDRVYHYTVNYQFNKSGIELRTDVSPKDFAYMQTNITESLDFRSPNNPINLTLQIGDFIDITFNTTSQKRINLNLYDNSTLQESYILSKEGNLDFSTRTITFTIGKSMHIDQIGFSGVFEEETYLRIDQILIYRLILNQSIYLNPYGLKTLYLTYPEVYDVYVFEKSVLRETFIVNTTSSLQTLILEYAYPFPVYFNYFDANNDPLLFNNYITYVNYTFGEDLFIDQRLEGNLLEVDEDSLIEYKIYDNFNVLIKSGNSFETIFVDITLNVFDLKIINKASEFVNYSLGNLDSEISKTGNILPDEILSFSIASGNYELLYTNHEDNLLRNYSFSFTTHRIITLNTTYNNVYFAPFLSNGLGFNYESVRFYINGSRKDFGSNILTSDSVNITVLDYFNQTIHSEILNVIGLNEYNIFLDLESFKIKSKAFEIINYTLGISGLTDSKVIFPEEIIEYFLIAGNYGFNYTNHENMQTYSLTVNIQQNYYLELNTTYFDVYFSIFNFDGLGLDKDLVRFYINNERKDFGFNTLIQDSNRLTVLDFFNGTLFNQVINLRVYTEYNILVEVYNLILHNNYSHAIYVEIERNNIEVKQLIPAHSSINYRFLPDVDYEVRYYDTNKNKLGELEIDLNKNNKIVSFGFYDVEVPISPLPILNSVQLLIWFGFFILGFSIIVLILYVRIRGRVKTKPSTEVRQYFARSKKKKKSSLSL